MLTHEQARTFYDTFGARQDWQRYYEGKAVDTLVRHGRFGTAQTVFEFGCGTGRLGETLLKKQLPATATYQAVDISQTMVDLSRQNLASFGAQAQVSQSSGPPRFELPDHSVDRFVSAYVFDLLSDEDIRTAVAEARRILTPNGLLLLTSLTHGTSRWGRFIERRWVERHQKDAFSVGGCRPIAITPFLLLKEWQVLYEETVSQWGLTSAVVAARPLP